MTKRSRVGIELVPRDFCRWPTEPEIVLMESSRTRAYLGMIQFSRENALASSLWARALQNMQLLGAHRSRVCLRSEELK